MKTQYIIKVAIIVGVVSGLFSVIGCVPVVAGGAAVGGKVLTQDKTVGESVSDTTIWTKIRASFISNNLDSLVGSVNVTVHDSRVLLTGRVKSNETMISIIRVCWDQSGVKEVINELKIDDENKKSFISYSKDTWITTRIKSKMLVSKEVKSVNYTIETIDGVVYLFGMARTQEELDTVTEIASTVSGVEKVISYVRVQGDLESRIEKTRVGENSRMTEYDDKPMPMDQNIQIEPDLEKKFMPNDIGSDNKKEDWQKEEEFDDTF
ncbi:MAG: BON domain-containing protein [Alphaproteobacteria bacterium]|jgi:osmotically-inducible protein OsmY